MNITHLLHDTAYVAQPGGTDVYGNPSWGAPTAIRCRYEERTKRTTDAETGDEVVSTAQLLTTASVGVGWRVWPPGADPNDPGAARKPKNVLRAKLGALEVWEVQL